MAALNIQVEASQIQVDEPLEILPDNHEAVQWFLMLQRRWVVSDMSGKFLRIDDHAVLAQMEMRSIKRNRRKTLLDELMLMESAALEILNKE